MLLVSNNLHHVSWHSPSNVSFPTKCHLAHSFFLHVMLHYSNLSVSTVVFALCFGCIYKIGFSCSMFYCSPIIGPTRRDTTAPGPKKYEVSSASFPADIVNNDEIIGMCLCLNTEHA